jgi:hypothetical protein
MRRGKIRKRAMGVLVMLSGSTMFGACNSELAREFRDVAGSGIQQGVTSIANSLIDGVFAVLDPNGALDPDANSSGN